MPLGRPRRIFRSSPLAPAGSRGGPLLAAALAVAVLAGGGWLLRGVRLPALPLLAGGGTPAAAAHVAAEAAQVAVLDGDTLRLRDVVVRLLGISAPPRGEHCRGADGSGFDCGAAATNALAQIVRARSVDCRLAGHDGMGHPLGVCEASGQQINRALVAAGYARVEDSAMAAGFAPRLTPAGTASVRTPAADLRDEEDQARMHRRGLWAGGAGVSW